MSKNEWTKGRSRLATVGEAPTGVYTDIHDLGDETSVASIMRSFCPLLAINCSGDGVELLLLAGGESYAVFIKSAQNEIVLTEIDGLLKSADIKPKQLQCVAVCVGPGSFTGTRVAVSVAKGFKCANDNLKLIKFDAFALLQADEMLSSPKKVGLWYVLPGFANFVYVRSANKQDACVDLNDLKKEIKNKDVVICAEEVYTKINKGKWMKPNGSMKQVVEAKLAAQEFVEISDLEPVYLRASQAELGVDKRYV